MLLKQLNYFATVAELGSFTEAAYALGISQSAVSQQIKALEEDLSVQLIIRNNRTFTLTRAGEYLAVRARQLITETEALRRETVRISHSKKRVIRLGFLLSYRGSELYAAITRYAKMNPGVEFDIASGSHEEIYEMLKSGKIDFALSDQRRAFSDDYENLVLSSPAVYIECAPQYSPGEASSFRAATLPDKPCILVAGVGQRDSEKSFYRELLGFSGSFLFADNAEEARLMAAAGRGFFPAEGEPEPVAASFLKRIPFFKDDKPVKRNFCAFWLKNNTSQVITDFSAILVDLFSKDVKSD